MFNVNERKRFCKPRLLQCHYSYPNKKMSSLLSRLRPSLSHASRHSRAWILAASYHEKVSKRFASLHSICKECELLQSLFTFQFTLPFSQVIDHYENPRNVGSFDKNDTRVGTGLVGAPACGDVMKLQVIVMKIHVHLYHFVIAFFSSSFSLSPD